jgi:glutamate-1-semialdehyde 2,1-aminomutase
MERIKSNQIYQRARELIPGGVNSPIRGFMAIEEMSPIAIERGKGPFIWDAGKKYIDYVLSWGSLILGHAHPQIVESINKQAERGTGFGAITNLEVELAELIVGAYDSIKKVRFVNSGTEATMSAVRLARGFTGRDKILKFRGGYHGHSDSLLIGTKQYENSPLGITANTAKDTLLADYNNIESVEKVLTEEGKNVAAIIVEPVAANMGLVLPNENFLPGLRKLANQYGAILIFDEVLTGFRIAFKGAESIYGVKPDLVTLGKVIGGGSPVGAYGGKAEIMDQLAPLGRVFQGGSQSGNSIGMVTGITQLNYLLNNPNIYEQFNQKTKRLVTGIVQAAEKAGIALKGQTIGSIFSLDIPNGEQFNEWFKGMLEKGVYFAPGLSEVGYISIAHENEQIDETITAASEVFPTIK